MCPLGPANASTISQIRKPVSASAPPMRSAAGAAVAARCAAVIEARVPVAVTAAVHDADRAADDRAERHGLAEREDPAGLVPAALGRLADAKADDERDDAADRRALGWDEAVVQELLLVGRRPIRVRWRHVATRRTRRVRPWRVRPWRVRPGCIRPGCIWTRRVRTRRRIRRRRRLRLARRRRRRLRIRPGLSASRCRDPDDRGHCRGED